MLSSFILFLVALFWTFLNFILCLLFFLTVCTQEVVSCFLEYKPDVDDYHTKEVQYEKTLSTTLGLFYFIFFCNGVSLSHKMTDDEQLITVYSTFKQDKKYFNVLFSSSFSFFLNCGCWKQLMNRQTFDALLNLLTPDRCWGLEWQRTVPTLLKCDWQKRNRWMLRRGKKKQLKPRNENLFQPFCQFVVPCLVFLSYLRHDHNRVSVPNQRSHSLIFLLKKCCCCYCCCMSILDIAQS